MQRLVAIAGLAAVAAAIAGAAAASRGFFAPPRTLVQFGYVRSIAPAGKGYVLRLDPAYWLTGQTALRAAAEDGREVDDDYYVLNPDHRLLVYRLPAGARATVLVVPAGSIRSVRVPVSELAQIVRGRNPRGRPLLERGGRRSLGYWVRTATDTVLSLDQQYQP